MNEFLAGFRRGFKRGIWLYFALPAAVVAAVVRTFITLCFNDEDSFDTSKKTSNS